MMRVSMILAVLLALPGGAFADCSADINKALPIANELPNPGGRAAVLQNILRARDSRHEGDEEACREQMREVMALICPAKPVPGAKRDARCDQ